MVAVEERSRGGQARVVRFGEVRAYGFVAPGNGGERAFVHGDDLLVGKGPSRLAWTSSSRWAQAQRRDLRRYRWTAGVRPGVASRYSGPFHSCWQCRWAARAV